MRAAPAAVRATFRRRSLREIESDISLPVTALQNEHGPYHYRYTANREEIIANDIRRSAPADGYPSTEASVDRARVLARALDSAVRIPGTNLRFGLDALLGLVPGLGDVTGAAMGGYLILLGSRLGAPKPVLARMVLNVALDTIAGVVPVVGDLFDVAWKANTRNMALLERYIDRPVETRKSSKGLLIVMIGVLGLLAIGGIVVAIVVMKWLIGLF